MKLRQLAIILFVLFLNGLWSSRVAAQSDEICVPTRLYGPSGFPWPTALIHSDHIAYNGGSPGNEDILYLYQISTGMIRQFNDPEEPQFVQTISENYVVAKKPGLGPTDELYLYEISSGAETRLTDNNVTEFTPDIDGDYIVWYDDYTRIFLYQISTGQTQQISPNEMINAASHPIIQGDVVAWYYDAAPDQDGGYDMAIYRIDTDELSLIPNSSELDFFNPQVYGDYVVWWEWSPFFESPGDIWLYKVSTGELTQLTDDALEDDRPRIYGDYVVWSRGDGHDSEIALYQISTEELTTLTDNDIADIVIEIQGDFIFAANGNNDLYLYQISTGEITTLVESLVAWIGINPGDAVSKLYDGNVVWDSADMQDVYFYNQAKPDLCAPNFLQNGSFEEGTNHWSGINLTADKVKCVQYPTDWKPYAYHQECSFRFRGSAAEASTLAQTVNLKSTSLQSGDTLRYGLWYSPWDVSPRTRLIAQVTYRGGQVEKFKVPFVKGKAGGYTMLQGDLTLSGRPKLLTIKIVNQTPVRKKDIFVDRVFVVQVPPSEDGLLPLPSAPMVGGDGLRK